MTWSQEMTLRKEEQAGGAEILLASLTGAKRVSLLEAAAILGLLGCGCFWPGQDCVVKSCHSISLQVESKVPDGYFSVLYDMALQGLWGLMARK